MISIDDFHRTELKVGTVLEAEKISGSNKLLKILLDLGEKDEQGDVVPRQIVSGIGKTYSPEDLIGRQIIIVSNLEPRPLMGLESAGMVIAASAGDDISLISPDKPIVPGTRLG